MAQYADREHYIPLRKNDLVDLIFLARRNCPRQTSGILREFCLLASAVFHFEHQQQLEALKDLYVPFDPDSDTSPLRPPDPASRASRLELLFGRFANLMERANFHRLSPEEMLRWATEDESGVWGVNMDVDTSVFERVDIFTRGDGVAKFVRRRWWKLWRKEVLSVPVYHRLVTVFKLNNT